MGAIISSTLGTLKAMTCLLSLGASGLVAAWGGIAIIGFVTTLIFSWSLFENHYHPDKGKYKNIFIASRILQFSILYALVIAPFPCILWFTHGHSLPWTTDLLNLFGYTNIDQVWGSMTNAYVCVYLLFKALIVFGVGLLVLSMRLMNLTNELNTGAVELKL